MRRTARGQALVELTLLLPLLVLLVMGAIDFGRLYFSYTTIANAAREGAMCASLGDACPAGAVGAASAEVSGTLPGGVTTTVAGGGASGSIVKVTVRYNFQAVTTAVLGTSTFPIQASASMVVQ